MGGNVCFQQDGETVHTADDSMRVVQRMLPGNVILRFEETPWLLDHLIRAFVIVFIGTHQITTLHSPTLVTGGTDVGN